ncbi:hypothetical protein FOZ62_010589, partial [Perkinsus olseni]
MGLTFSRIGLLLAAAAATQPNLRQDVEYDFWAPPPPGHYKNDNPSVVELLGYSSLGKPPGVALNISYDEANRHQKFEIGIGIYSEQGYLQPIEEKHFVALQKADGTEETRYPFERCATLIARTGYMIQAAYIHYGIHGWQDFTSTSSLYLCLVDMQGWTIYLGAEKADDHVTRLCAPVTLASTTSTTSDRSTTIEARDEKAPAESSQETAPGSVTLRKAGAMNLQSLDLPSEGYYVGAFGMKEHGKKGRVKVTVKVAGSEAQLILGPDLGQDDVRLGSVPLQQASNDCWRLAVKSLDENMGHIEGAVAAIRDLAGIDSLDMEDIFLCFVDGKWKL